MLHSDYSIEYLLGVSLDSKVNGIFNDHSRHCRACVNRDVALFSTDETDGVVGENSILHFGALKNGAVVFEGDSAIVISHFSSLDPASLTLVVDVVLHVLQAQVQVLAVRVGEERA